MQARGRLRRAGELGQPRRSPRSTARTPAGDSAPRSRPIAQQRREPALGVERRPVVARSSGGARAGRAGARRTARPAAARRTPARRPRGRAASPRPSSSSPAASSRPASTQLEREERVADRRAPPGTRSAAGARPSQRSPAASVAYSPGRAPARVFTNARAAVLQLEPPRVVDVAAGDAARAARRRAPAAAARPPRARHSRPSARSASSSPRQAASTRSSTCSKPSSPP